MAKIELYKFERNEKESVLFSLGDYKDKTYLDIRIFFLNDQNELTPTKKGITISTDLMGEFVEGIRAVQKHLRSEVAPTER